MLLVSPLGSLIMQGPLNVIKTLSTHARMQFVFVYKNSERMFMLKITENHTHAHIIDVKTTHDCGIKKNDCNNAAGRVQEK